MLPKRQRVSGLQVLILTPTFQLGTLTRAFSYLARTWHLLWESPSKTEQLHKLSLYYLCTCLSSSWNCKYLWGLFCVIPCFHLALSFVYNEVIFSEHLLCARYCLKELVLLFYWIITINFWDRDYYHLHLEMKILSHWSYSLTVSKWWSQYLKVWVQHCHLSQ